VGNVEIATPTRRIVVTALPDGRWEVDHVKLDHDDMLVAVLSALGARG
jgi:hypothetical protein